MKKITPKRILFFILVVLVVSVVNAFVLEITNGWFNLMAAIMGVFVYEKIFK